MLVFGCITIVSTIIQGIYMQETKGKTKQQIEEIFTYYGGKQGQSRHNSYIGL
jgi:hypothetical protein